MHQVSFFRKGIQGCILSSVHSDGRPIGCLAHLWVKLCAGIVLATRFYWNEFPTLRFCYSVTMSSLCSETLWNQWVTNIQPCLPITCLLTRKWVLSLRIVFDGKTSIIRYGVDGDWRQVVLKLWGLVPETTMLDFIQSRRMQCYRRAILLLKRWSIVTNTRMFLLPTTSRTVRYSHHHGGIIAVA